MPQLVERRPAFAGGDMVLDLGDGARGQSDAMRQVGLVSGEVVEPSEALLGVVEEVREDSLVLCIHGLDPTDLEAAAASTISDYFSPARSLHLG